MTMNATEATGASVRPNDAEQIAARAGLNVPSGVHDLFVCGDGSQRIQPRSPKKGASSRPRDGLFVRCRRCGYALFANGEIRKAGDGACEE